MEIQIDEHTGSFSLRVTSDLEAKDIELVAGSFPNLTRREQDSNKEVIDTLVTLASTLPTEE